MKRTIMSAAVLLSLAASAQDTTSNIATTNIQRIKF